VPPPTGIPLSPPPVQTPPADPAPEFPAEVSGGPVAEPDDGPGGVDAAPDAGGDAVSMVVGMDAPMPEAYPSTTTTAATSAPATSSSRWSPGQDALANKDMGPPADAVHELRCPGVDRREDSRRLRVR